MKQPSPTPDDTFFLAGKPYRSRLLVGTGRYADWQIAKEAIEASGAEIVTVAIRRARLDQKNDQALESYINPEQYTFLPNSAGCYTAEEAVRTLKLAREIGGWNLVKLEVIGHQKTLYPNMPETLRAAKLLTKENFSVMAYCTDDPIMTKQLEEEGCVAVMPLGAPIGSGLGIQNPLNIRLIAEQSRIPVLVDAGVGTASDAAIAMELGCDAVLINTAIAKAKDPVKMALAMKKATEAGRLSYLAGRMPKQDYASASTPEEGKIT